MRIVWLLLVGGVIIMATWVFRNWVLLDHCPNEYPFCQRLNEEPSHAQGS